MDVGLSAGEGTCGPAGGGEILARSSLWNQPLRQGWTLFLAGVIQGERQRAGLGLRMVLWLSACVKAFTPLLLINSHVCLCAHQQYPALF